MDRAEERKLIRRAAAGDKQAAGECIRAYQGQLYAYILRLSGRPDIAEDIVQEAFVRVLTNLDRFDDRYRFSTWLFTIARRLYVNAMQKLKPVYESDIVGSWQGDGSLPEHGTIGAEVATNARSELERALQQLPPEQREVVVLFHQFDWPIARISQHMEMPEGTVKSHLHRGRKRLRSMLEASERATERIGEVWGDS
ncbi:MAG: RNA polymerase sigma factor [Phycisphaerales bacterium]|jgi:RNA polymerase sigma-70 factor (ECF subfamily)|nr:RNA polymerase sigma factor [Phycisphaerales bacterium]